MSGHPLVSVVIPCYNTERFVRAAIESVQAQTYPHFDITVVDDGSKDNSAAVVEALPGVRLVRQPNQGECGARNSGIRESRGEFLVFLDADDRLLPDALRIGVEALSARPDHGFVFGFSRPIAADGRVLGDGVRPSYPSPSFRTFLAGRGIVPPAVAMFRRTAADAVGGFRVGMKMAPDHEFYLRVAQRYPIYCHDRVIAEYRNHSANVTKQSTTRLFLGVLEAMELQADFIRGNPDLEEALRIGRKHWGRVFGRSMSFELIRHLKRGHLKRGLQTASILARYYPGGFWEVTRFHLDRLVRGDKTAAGAPVLEPNAAAR